MSALVTTNTAKDVQAFHQKYQCFDWRLSQEHLKKRLVVPRGKVLKHSLGQWSLAYKHSHLTPTASHPPLDMKIIH